MGIPWLPWRQTNPLQQTQRPSPNLLQLWPPASNKLSPYSLVGVCPRHTYYIFVSVNVLVFPLSYNILTLFFFFILFLESQSLSYLPTCVFAASSRLGRALAELFGLLVKLCVGSPVRQRRSHHATSTGTTPTPAARATASALTKLLTKGLSWQPPPYTPTPRFR